MAEKVVKRTPPKADEEELNELMQHDSTQIRDVDIRESTATKLRFRKMPWHELVGFAILASLAILCLALRSTLPDEKEWKLR